MQRCFISYPTSHEDHASFLKKNLESLYPENLDIFMASDGKSIGPGENWYDSIIKNIRDINYFLVLLPSFEVSQWVMFEAGAAVIKDVNVIPLRYCGLQADFVPAPLMPKQSIDLTNEIEVSELLKRLALNRKPTNTRLNSYVNKIVLHFKNLNVEDVNLTIEGRQVPPLESRLQNLSVASNIQRNLFFYILKNSDEKGLPEANIRKNIPIKYHDYTSDFKEENKGKVVCPSEYYFRLRDLYHLGFLEMEKISEFENRWMVRSDIKESLKKINPYLVSGL